MINTVGDFLWNTFKECGDMEVIEILKDEFIENDVIFYSEMMKDKLDDHTISDNLIKDFLVNRYMQLLQEAVNDIIDLIASNNNHDNIPSDKLFITMGYDNGHKEGPACEVYCLDKKAFLNDYKYRDPSVDFDYMEVMDAYHPLYKASKITLMPREELINLRFASPNVYVAKEDIAAAILKDTTTFGFSNKEFEEGRKQELYQIDHPEEDDNYTPLEDEEIKDFDYTSFLLNQPEEVKDRDIFNYRMEIMYFNRLYDWLTNKEVGEHGRR